MPIITDKITNILKNKELTVYKVSQLMNFSEGALRQMISTKSPFSDKAKEKILPILEVSREEFESWIIANKYSLESIKLAIKTKNETKTENNKLILTSKIDGFLSHANLSRTALSKQINYNQSSFNSMVVGKLSISKSVLVKLSIAFAISQDEILAWVLADKYDLKTLELAVLAKNV